MPYCSAGHSASRLPAVLQWSGALHRLVAGCPGLEPGLRVRDTLPAGPAGERAESGASLLSLLSWRVKLGTHWRRRLPAVFSRRQPLGRLHCYSEAKCTHCHTDLSVLDLLPARVRAEANWRSSISYSRWLATQSQSILR